MSVQRTSSHAIKNIQHPRHSGPGAPPDAERVRRLCRGVARQVAAARDVPIRALLGPTRAQAEIAAARQVAMYLCHTLLSLTMSEVGYAFGRDRTTVAHACGVVEDLRDDRAVDAELTALEGAIAAAQALARGQSKADAGGGRHAGF